MFKVRVIPCLDVKDGRVEIEHGRACHVALLQAHALAVLEIDGGKKDHGFHFRKLAIRASPKRWLFSG